MDDMKVWFITGASRGMGAHFGRRLPAAGSRLVVAVAQGVGTSPRIWVR